MYPMYWPYLQMKGTYMRGQWGQWGTKSRRWWLRKACKISPPNIDIVWNVQSSGLASQATANYSYFVLEYNTYFAWVFRASSWRPDIRPLFHCFSSFVSKLRHNSSGLSSKHSFKRLSWPSSIWLITATIIIDWLSSYWWWTQWTYLPQWSPSTTTSNPLSCVGLGYLRETCSGGRNPHVL